MTLATRQYLIAVAASLAALACARVVPLARETPAMLLLAGAVAQALTLRTRAALLGIVISAVGLELLRPTDSLAAHVLRMAMFVLLSGAVVAIVHGRRRSVEASRQYRVLFDQNPLPMWLYDDDTLEFLAVNHAATEKYGYSHEEFARMTLRQIRPEEDLSLLAARPAKGLAQYTGAWRHRTKDGRLLEVLVRSSLVEREGRRARLALLEDMTDRTKLERQLRQSQKMEAVGQLAGGVAHDFNNMLTAIFGYCDLLAADLSPDDPHSGDVQEIRKAASSAAALTRQLLTFSRQQIIEPKVVDLNTVVTEMNRLLERVIGEDIDLAVRLRSTLSRVKADPNQLEQVLMNLVVNARDAMPHGGQLTIETDDITLDESYTQGHVGVLPGPYVMLAVSDTGSGMSSEVQSRIFEPFFTTKPTGHGTGLGLSTVYGIVKQSGGTVWVYSEVGHGTTFKVYLPRVDASITEGAAPATALHDGSHATILVVEDNLALERIARRILGRHGYTVLSATSPDDAVQVSRMHPGPIDVLLSDIVMPGRSGPSLAAQLTIERPEMRVLHMSGYTDDAVVRHGALDGTVAFLQKPFTPETLVGKVREVLNTPASTTH